VAAKLLANGGYVTKNQILQAAGIKNSKNNLNL
jgi:hypothetical protein